MIEGRPGDLPSASQDQRRKERGWPRGTPGDCSYSTWMIHKRVPAIWYHLGMPKSFRSHCPPKMIRRTSTKRGPDLRESSCKRGYGSTWRKIRLMILRGEPICRHCQQAAATDVDHIIPRRAGGPDTQDNLQPLCHSCHSIKTQKESR